MAGQSRKWMIVVATIWIQAFTGTNFDFSAYSSALKAAMGISQVELNYLATASDMGKLFGWSSGLALLYLPLPAVLLISALAGLGTYTLQWLVVTSRISLPYLAVFLLCLLAGCSICWFNTVCFVLCIRNFPLNRSLALSLSISFNGVSAALYSLFASSLSSSASSSLSSSSIYLLLNATLPLFVSLFSLIPILRQPPDDLIHLPVDNASHDTHRFLLLHILAFFTGLYLLFLNSVSANSFISAIILAGAIVLLVLPLGVPGVVYARDWAHRNIYSSFTLELPDAPLIIQNDVSNDIDELTKPLVSERINRNGELNEVKNRNGMLKPKGVWTWLYKKVVETNRLEMLGEEHCARRLVTRIDFWLYYVAYFCGATVGLVYSNNLGQITESLNLDSDLTMILVVYSACSFFGRLLSAIPDFLRGRVNFARTGWLAIALVPMPVALFILTRAGTEQALLVGTALIGLSSGFIFAAAVSVTSELFGARSIGVDHNMLITNIPFGSLLYGQIAAIVYDINGTKYGVRNVVSMQHEYMVVCMGRKCYALTFFIWGCITLLGLFSSFLLFLRTRQAYAEAERKRRASQEILDIFQD
ncbi:hypothetical protein LUZ60_014161 [Juncus effusus]|nr:hypothetical protein LUZ60_014161 [Juncus effusus]